jgi:hypothetical protein
MEHDEAHAAQGRLMDALGDRDADVSMPLMPPPDQNVRVLDHLLAQPVLRHLHRRGSHGNVLRPFAETPR